MARPPKEVVLLVFRVINVRGRSAAAGVVVVAAGGGHRASTRSMAHVGTLAPPARPAGRLPVLIRSVGRFAATPRAGAAVAAGMFAQRAASGVVRGGQLLVSAWPLARRSARHGEAGRGGLGGGGTIRRRRSSLRFTQGGHRAAGGRLCSRWAAGHQLRRRRRGKGVAGYGYAGPEVSLEGNGHWAGPALLAKMVAGTFPTPLCRGIGVDLENEIWAPVAFQIDGDEGGEGEGAVSELHAVMDSAIRAFENGVNARGRASNHAAMALDELGKKAEVKARRHPDHSDSGEGVLWGPSMDSAAASGLPGHPVGQAAEGCAVIGFTVGAKFHHEPRGNGGNIGGSEGRCRDAQVAEKEVGPLFSCGV